ncbi:MAG: hypothetical protein II855_04870 [Candidatus Methanomethylophilaceae archaeon]|nr:hypothetical protein [Candidatus Methanomethylophilaceae archaeon]
MQHVQMSMKTDRCLPFIAVMAVLLAAMVPIVASPFSDDSFAAEDGSSTYYRDQLSNNEKVLYNKFLDAADTLMPSNPYVVINKSDFTPSGFPSSDSIHRAYYAFYYDHPEKFWMCSSMEGSSSSGDSWSLPITLTAETDEELLKQKADVASSVEKLKIDGEFTYDKVKQIHDWIVSNVRYDSEAVGDNKAYMAHNIYGVFVKKTCVCEGYARAFMYMCQKNCIDCIVSIGKGVTDKSSESHMWNYVKMEDGKWYCMDVTWDDPLVDGADSGKVYYSYFLKGTESVYNDKKFTASHVDEMKTEHNLNIPELSADPYRFQPGGTESLKASLCDKDAEGNIKDTYTLQVDRIDEIRENIGSAGTALVQTKDLQFTFTCAELKKIKEKLESESVTEVVFGGTTEVRKVKAIAQLDYEKDVTMFTPTISTGDIASLGLSEITIGLKADMQQLDLSVFMYVWDYTDPDSPQKIKATYDGTYENFTVDKLGSAYCAGNNPVTPAVDIPFVLLIGALVLIVVFLLLLIKALFRHRKIKKMARTMAKSQRNMQHYKQLYDDRELSSNERKAYLKAVKIYKKNQNKKD